jgi:hypothetical protein
VSADATGESISLCGVAHSESANEPADWDAQEQSPARRLDSEGIRVSISGRGNEATHRPPLAILTAGYSVVANSPFSPCSPWNSRHNSPNQRRNWLAVDDLQKPPQTKFYSGHPTTRAA